MPDDGAELLEELMRFRPEGMTANAWAVRAGVSRTIWSDLRRHGNPSRRTLSKLLEAAGSSLAEFEALRVGRSRQEATTEGQVAETGQGWRAPPSPDLPILWAERNGVWGREQVGIDLFSIDRGRVVDRLPTPPSLASDRGAYGVAIVAESMWPRFRLGRRVAVSPASPVSLGDDVLVVLANGRGALIGELLSQGPAAIRLRQFNPPLEFEVPAREVATVHKLLGEMI